MSKREEIDKRLVYTCRCGWIDKGHARPDSTRPFVGAKNLWHQIMSETGKKSRRRGKTGFKVTYVQDMGKSLFGKTFRSGMTRSYFVESGLSIPDKHSVALSIFLEVTFAFETYQGEWPWKAFTGSSFSVEDLISNLIGFYQSIAPDRDYLSLCEPVSQAASLAVWDSYGSVEENKNRFLGPILFPCYECKMNLGGPISGILPPALNTVKPAEKGKYFRDWNPFDEANFEKEIKTDELNSTRPRILSFDSNGVGILGEDSPIPLRTFCNQ